jgi:hypothetical protein
MPTPTLAQTANEPAPAPGEIVEGRMGVELDAAPGTGPLSRGAN